MKGNEKLFYLGKFGETISYSEEKNEMVKEAEMFSTGIHRGVEYTEEDLTELSNNFNAEDEIPLQLDHSESARDTVGYLQETSIKDGKLMGKVKIIDEYAQERINKGLMKKLSVSFYLKYSENGIKPHKIREVSLVAFPQVKGARLFSENGYVSDYNEDNKGGNEMTFDIEKFKEELRAEFATNQDTQLQEQFSQMQTQLEALKLANAKHAELQVASKVAKFQEENKMVPAQAESLTKLLASFSEEQAGLFDEFMSNSQKVSFSETETGEHEEPEHPSTEDKQTQEQKDFDAFYEQFAEKHGSSL
ncbi:hypothetical protein [Priestia megaterium]|uniref:hypothetical protein n=1 Tax=Priestia megaterium TaxID=1404 RepID=UPI0015CF29D2|nr:hypothetical protein [Priestia megaterium]